MTKEKNLQLQKVSIIAHGSRGDIQPYVAIAIQLKKEGYYDDVRILTNEDHQALVESFDGLMFVPIFYNANKVLKSHKLLMKSMAEGDTAVFFKAGNEIWNSDAPRSTKRFLKEMQNHRPDLLITSSLCPYLEWYSRIILDLPTLRVHLTALSWNKKRAPLGVPTLPFGLHNYLLFKYLLTNNIDKSYILNDDAMVSNGGERLFPKIHLDGKEVLNPQLPRIVCQSKSFQTILNPNIHPNYKFVGAAIIDDQNEIQHPDCFGGGNNKENNNIFDILERFLADDTTRKPVYMGWGSMTCKSPEHMVVLAVQALQISNQRGIILGGWANLSFDLLKRSSSSTEEEDNDNSIIIEYAKKNVLFVEKAPHEWLFPRVSAAVHHGGAGTTNATLRAGLPTIITPVFLDQFDHSYLINELRVGIGFERQFQKLSAKELADAITTVVNSNDSDEYQRNARKVSNILLKEDGAKAVVKEMENYWEEYVLTGKFKEIVKRKMKKPTTDDGKHIVVDNSSNNNHIIMIAAMVVGAAFAIYQTRK